MTTDDQSLKTIANASASTVVPLFFTVSEQLDANLHNENVRNMIIMTQYYSYAYCLFRSQKYSYSVYLRQRLIYGEQHTLEKRYNVWQSLGTFQEICAIDEVQNPLPLKTMLFKRHMTSIMGISDTFANS